jgi:hypothetical protein
MLETDIAYFRHQQLLQDQAAQNGLSGLASVATRRSITARMERASYHIQVLCATGKEQEARAPIISDTFYEDCEEASWKSF